MIEQTFDQAKSETFAEQLIGVLNHAAMALMISVGHQVGLFDTLARLPPATSEQIASAAGLHERYVREWLGAMVSGQVVDYDAAGGRYALPPEHAGWLTRAAGANNLAVQMQYIPLLAQVETAVIECFRHGGGVPYSAYPRFQQLMGEDSAAVHDAALIDAILPLVPGLPQRLQVGMQVADIGCGRGHASILMAQAFPMSQFVGYDLSEEGIEAGRMEARALGLSNAQFEVRDVTQLEVADRFGLITAFDAIHDQAEPEQVLSNIARALRSDGVFLMVDFAASSHVHENRDHLLGPFMYTASCMHCVTVSLSQGGAGLGAMWGAQKALQLLAAAGFTDVQIKRIEGDLFNNYYICRQG